MSGGTKHDAGKVRMELLRRSALEGTARVLGFGAEKYGDYNWLQGFKWSRLYGAALRHLFAHMDGENTDPESGLSHLDHAACCLMFLQASEKEGLGTDDRYIADEDSIGVGFDTIYRKQDGTYCDRTEEVPMCRCNGGELQPNYRYVLDGVLYADDTLTSSSYVCQDCGCVECICG
jgi:hypothetical protein